MDWDWIRENFIFFVFAILFIVMHFIGYGLHGGPGGHSDEEEGNEKHTGERPESESGRKEHR